MSYTEAAAAVKKLSPENQFRIVVEIVGRQVRRVEQADSSSLNVGWEMTSDRLRAYAEDIGDLSRDTDAWIERGFQLKAYAKEHGAGLDLAQSLLQDTEKFIALKARRWPTQSHARLHWAAVMARHDWVRQAVQALHKHPECHGMVERYRKLWGGGSRRVDPRGQKPGRKPVAAHAAPEKVKKYNPYADKTQTRFAQ